MLINERSAIPHEKNPHRLWETSLVYYKFEKAGGHAKGACSKLEPEHKAAGGRLLATEPSR